MRATLDDAGNAGQQPRHAEADHHSHDDADVRKDFRASGERLFGRHG